MIAATKSGTEKNATVFARYWVEALQDPAADTDKSDSISAMEAFTYAAKKTAAFYDSQKRLATEHAVFDDVGHGEPVREAGNGQGAVDVEHHRAAAGEQSCRPATIRRKRALLEKKETLEQKIDTLKYQKAAMDPDGLQEAVDGGAAGTGEGAGGAGQMKRLCTASCLLAVLPAARMLAAPCGLLGTAQAWPAAHEARACFEGLTRSSDAYARAEGFWGLEQWEQANEQFRLATQQRQQQSPWSRCAGACCCMNASMMPKPRICFVKRWQGSIECAKRMSGLAIVSGEGFSGKATEYAAKAIELDPKLAEAHELMADLALANDDTRRGRDRSR